MLGSIAQAACRSSNPYRPLLQSACGAACRLESSLAPPPPEGPPLERLHKAITPGVCADLWRDGYAVVDNVFGPAHVARLRADVEGLRPHMHPNSTHLVRGGGGTHLLAKQGIIEAELLSEVRRLGRAGGGRVAGRRPTGTAPAAVHTLWDWLHQAARLEPNNT